MYQKSFLLYTIYFNMKLTAGLTLFLIISAAINIYGESSTYIGGKALLGSKVFIDSQGEFPAKYTGMLSLNPQLSIENRTGVLSVSGSLHMEAEKAEPATDVHLEIDTFSAELYPFPFLTFRFGRFSYLPSPSDFLAVSNFFSGLSFTQLMSEDYANIKQPADIFQAVGYLGLYYLKLTATPFVKGFDIPSPESPWFSRNNLPETIPTGLGNTIPLRNIYVKNTEPAIPLTPERINWGIEAGGSIGRIDLSAHWYAGYDNDPLYTAEIERFESKDVFDINLYPEYRKKSSIALSGVSTLGAFRGYFDGAYTFHKLFSTKLATIHSAYTATTIVMEAPALEYTLGTSYEFPFYMLTAGIEYTDITIFTDETVILKPSFGSGFAGYITMSLLDYKLSPSLFFLVCRKDWEDFPKEWSSAVFLDMRYITESDMEFIISTPLFFGKEHTELGQYAGNYLFSAGIQFRF